jgi:hypothetical protein
MSMSNQRQTINGPGFIHIVLALSILGRRLKMGTLNIELGEPGLGMAIFGVTFSVNVDLFKSKRTEGSILLTSESELLRAEAAEA